MSLLQDWQFRAALIVAPLVWIALLFVQPTTQNIFWPLDAPARFLRLVVLYPLFEELAFRGWLQSTLYSHRFCRKKLAGISFANATHPSDKPQRKILNQNLIFRKYQIFHFK